MKKYADEIITFCKEYKPDLKYVSKGTSVQMLTDFLMAKNWTIEQIVDYFNKNNLNMPSEREDFAKKIKSAYNTL